MQGAERTSAKRLLSMDEAAEFLGITSRSVHNLITRGILEPVQIPTIRRTLVDRRDLERLVLKGKAVAETKREGNHGDELG